MLDLVVPAAAHGRHRPLEIIGQSLAGIERLSHGHQALLRRRQHSAITLSEGHGRVGIEPAALIHREIDRTLADVNADRALRRQNVGRSDTIHRLAHLPQVVQHGLHQRLALGRDGILSGRALCQHLHIVERQLHPDNLLKIVERHHMGRLTERSGVALGILLILADGQSQSAPDMNAQRISRQSLILVPVGLERLAGHTTDSQHETQLIQRLALMQAHIELVHADAGLDTTDTKQHPAGIGDQRAGKTHIHLIVDVLHDARNFLRPGLQVIAVENMDHAGREVNASHALVLTDPIGHTLHIPVADIQTGDNQILRHNSKTSLSQISKSAISSMSRFGSSPTCTGRATGASPETAGAGGGVTGFETGCTARPAAGTGA